MATTESKKTPNATVALVSASASASPDRRPKVLKIADARTETAYAWSKWTKARVIAIIMLCQISMNFNAAVYPNGKAGLMDKFGVSRSVANLGQALFLILYGFGCELWAPLSEEAGRFWIMQISLGLVNLWQIPAATASSFDVVLVMRVLGGLSSAGGSVTLGIVPDMYEPGFSQQLAVLFVVFSSCSGAVIAPIIGGPLEKYASVEWIFWTQLILGALAQGLHFFFVPETRADILLDREAKRRRALPIDHPEYDAQYARVVGPLEVRGSSLWARLSWRQSLDLMLRPYHMLLTEPIVGIFSLLSGFSDMLIFVGLDAWGYITDMWGLDAVSRGLTFIAILVGYLACFAFSWFIYARDEEKRKQKEAVLVPCRRFEWEPERKLRPLVFVAPLLTVGLTMIGMAALGPAFVHHWIFLCFAASLLAIANMAIYLYTVDYMVATYGEYAASATGGNGFCRDVLAGCAAFFTRPYFEMLDKPKQLRFAVPVWILAAIGLLLTVSVYVIYPFGAWIRGKSSFACKLLEERAETDPALEEAIVRTTPANSRRNSASL